MENKHSKGSTYTSPRALLNHENAVSHLYHFCATLPADEFLDLRPEFMCTSVNEKEITAKVVLPPCVDEKYRYAESTQLCLSENAAIRDAAFEACLSLYRGGLINENLLPLMRHGSDEKVLNDKIETRASHQMVGEQFNTWLSIAKLWDAPTGADFHNYSLHIESEDSIIISIDMILPAQLLDIKPFLLYWDETKTMKVTILSDKSKPTTLQAKDKDNGRLETKAILTAAYGNQKKFDGSDFAAIFMANSSVTSAMLRKPVLVHASRVSFPKAIENSTLIIRDTLNDDRPMLFEKWIADKPAKTEVRRAYWKYDSFPENVPYLAMKRISKRTDFLHPIPLERNIATSQKPFEYTLPVSKCFVEELPLNVIQFGHLMPSILHRIQVYMTANKLATTILQDVKFSNIQLVISAISTPAAQEEQNYQRLEFLGDSLLKLSATVQVLRDHPPWHEGYLSSQKDRFVSNARLSRAAIEIGLDKFILTKIFTGQKWKPPYISDLLNAGESNAQRQMSTKVLADVVEALLGAAMVDGGIDKVVKCLRIFIPEARWMTIEINREALFEPLLSGTLPVTLEPLEKLIGYTFKKKSLLVEAMTHGSCTTAKASYERLEFLGDSVLDTIIVDKVFNHPEQLPVPKMHLLRTALVNGDFLAFMCMQFSSGQEQTALVENESTGEIEPKTSTIFRALWRYMIHSSPTIAQARQAALDRANTARLSIQEAIQTGNHYPWMQLASLQTPKFFSDIVESLLGAMWVDSGSFEVCENVLEQMGILAYLRRIIQDDVRLLHPKEELGRLAVSAKVNYQFSENRVQGKAWCKVTVGSRLVGKAEGALGTRELLEGMAAEQAVNLLRTEQGLD